ncbi:MAG: hypothetical protein LQ342_004330 [Letrouitia transgressa]|nr:MAG: hypothetical protein LQ342_004330 [Letrouitia transgressa]
MWFDDRKDATPGSPVIPVAVYKLLNWPGINLGVNVVVGNTGVITQSPPNDAVFNLETRAGSLLKPASITVQNGNSAVKSFKLFSFYYACAAATQEGLVSAPAPCTLTIKGFNAQGTQVASQSFVYEVKALKQGQALATVDSHFTGLYKVSFEVDGGLIGNTAKVGVLDTFSLATCTG